MERSQQCYTVRKRQMLCLAVSVQQDQQDKKLSVLLLGLGETTAGALLGLAVGDTS